MSEVNIVVLVGSLRGGSVNGIVAGAAMSHGPDTVTFTPYALDEVPLYNGDIEEAGLPASVQGLHDAVGAADGLLIFSPEYNGSFPAVTKNAIDWMSRPPGSWEGTAVSLVVTTPGPRAGASIRGHFDAIMAFQPIRLFESLGIGGYGEKVVDGELTDVDTLAALADHVSRFAAFCADAPE